MPGRDEITPDQDAFQLLLDALDRSGIRYMVAGSVASAFHGIPRSTNDVDIVADIREEHISPLALTLSGAFYADPETMREALTYGRSFNVIHFATGDKFDVFPVAGNRYSDIQIERSAPQHLSGLTILCPVATAEDTSCPSSSGTAPGAKYRIGNGTTFVESAPCRARRWTTYTWNNGREN